MKLPIDTASLSFVLADEAVEDIDFETKRPRVDHETGEVLYRISMLAMGDGPPDLLKVKVPGQPKGLTVGAPVRPVGFYAQQWKKKDDHGVAFRATKVEPARPEPARTGS